MDDLDLLVELFGEHADGLVGERLCERGHLAQLHQLLDDLGRGQPEGLGDLAYGGARVDRGDRRLFDDVFLRGQVGLDPRCAPATAAPGWALRRRRVGAAGARGLRVDDHATAASAGGYLIPEAARTTGA